MFTVRGSTRGVGRGFQVAVCAALVTSRPLQTASCCTPLLLGFRTSGLGCQYSLNTLWTAWHIDLPEGCQTARTSPDAEMCEHYHSAFVAALNP